MLEFPALLPDLLIDLRKLLIEIRFFCKQGFAWNAASIQDLFCIVIFCFSRFKSGEGSFCCQRVKELLVFFLADVQNRALLGKLCDLILCCCKQAVRSSAVVILFSCRNFRRAL